MPTEPATEPSARRGRRRSQDSRLAILTAAYELVAEVGYQALTIEGVAERAGCGKQTVYRWWPHKADVLLEALALKADLRVSTADRGSWAADLTVFLTDSAELGRLPGVAPVLRALMAQAQIDTAFGGRFRADFLQRRRAALSVLTDRARERGDLPDLSAELLVDIVFGVIWYRLLSETEPVITGLDVQDLTALLAPVSPPTTT